MPANSPMAGCSEVVFRAGRSRWPLPCRQVFTFRPRLTRTAFWEVVKCLRPDHAIRKLRLGRFAPGPRAKLDSNLRTNELAISAAQRRY